MNNLTIVTGLFDLGRDKLPEGFRRDFSHYIECFEKFLIATQDYPLAVFIEPENEAIVWKHRSYENTRVFHRTLDELRKFPFYDNVQAIRTDPKWYGQSGWMPDSPQAKLELYNPMVMSKHFMLHDASIFNFAETKYFLWMDAGLSNTVNLKQYIDENFGKRITPQMKKMLYLCFPYDGDVEVHGFPKPKMDQMAGKKTEYVARGGVFGGSKDAVSRMNGLYYNALSESFDNGWMGTEESIFTILTYRHPELCNIHMIESDGLVYKFFEDLKESKVNPVRSSDVALYALTFNLPQQFSLWVESFKKTYPKEFSQYPKYVVNNSTDPSVDAEYQRLFRENGFKEFKFDNIGINDGRHFCAEHFDQSNHDFMIFFEDDMLWHSDPTLHCRNGFTTYHPELIDKALDIVESEDLDYLKLTFSEFYGDNHDNWAWYNVKPESAKMEYFPIRKDGVSEKKVRIDYTGTHRGLPYAVGEYHYCNWPVLFTKRGSRKVFLETVFEHKHEQTIMSQTMSYIFRKELKVGCLLASPVNHFRKYHYDGKKRKEHKHHKTQ